MKQVKKKTQLNKKINNENSINLHKNLKSVSYKSSLKRIRKLLPNQFERVVSKFMHGDGIDNMNEILIKTIARPNGILIGSLFALLATLTTVYLAIYYGYSYNYLLLFMSFVIGYLIECVVAIVTSITKPN